MHGGEIPVKHDFSVNINPLGVPKSVRKAYFRGMKTVSAYPDIKCITLRSLLSERLCRLYNANSGPENILCGNGASELIPAVFRSFGIKKALLVSPCFTGYERALKSCGAEITYFNLKEEKEFELGTCNIEEFLSIIDKKSFDAVIIANPNNPNGRLTEPFILEKIADACLQKGCLFFIDECFMELTAFPEKYSFIPKLMEYKNAVVLRAFTKTFAIPGLRLGYIVCSDKNLITEVEKQLPEWNVSSIAQLCGISCMAEDKYLSKSRVVISENLRKQNLKLKALGFKTYSSDSSFILFKSELLDLKERLLQRDILIRECSDYEGLEKGFYRVSVKSEKENKLLIRVLSEVIKNGVK